MLGCTEHKLSFAGGIVLLQRGGCYFSWKASQIGFDMILVSTGLPHLRWYWQKPPELERC